MPGTSATRGAAGIYAETVELPSLALDVDTPDDLAAAEQMLASHPWWRRTYPRNAAAAAAQPRMTTISATALEGLPEIRGGDDPAVVIATAAGGHGLQAGDVLVVAHKLISKAEGRTRRLSEVTPGERAQALARQLDKDPRLVEVMLDETAEIRRGAQRRLDHRHPSRIRLCQRRRRRLKRARRRHRDPAPERSRPLGSSAARRVGAAGRRPPGVVITDSFGRAWRTGQSDVAIGCAGIIPIDDWRGRADMRGRELRATVIAVADELAAGADLARAKDAMQPAIVVRGASRWVTDDDGPGVAPLLRDAEHDLFR